MLTNEQIEVLRRYAEYVAIPKDSEAFLAAISLAERVRDAVVVGLELETYGDRERINVRERWGRVPDGYLDGKRVALVGVE